jgi:hypothetical protein
MKKNVVASAENGRRRIKKTSIGNLPFIAVYYI